MHKITCKKAVSAFLIISMVLAVLPRMRADAVDYTDKYVRVGLAYDTTARNSAVFQVASGTGTGFEAGYIDSATDVFTSYYKLNVTKVTVARSCLNYRIADGAYVADGSEAAGTIGKWHLEVGVSAKDEAEVNAMMKTVSEAISKAIGMSDVCYPAYTGNGYRVRIGMFTSNASANLYAEPAAAVIQAIAGYENVAVTVVSGGSNGFFVLNSATGALMFEWDGSTRWLALRATGGDAPETIFRSPDYGTRRYYGVMDLMPGSSSSVFAVVNVVRLDLYVRGVVPYELNTYWPDETLKAMAVIVATYAMYNENRHSADGFDLCTGQHCEVYEGIGSDTLRNETETIIRCCDAVKGMVITYNGRPIQAVFHASSGGVTEDSENVWVASLPYLRSVKDDYESGTPGATKEQNGIWTNTLTASQVKAKLTAKGYTIGNITDVWVSARTAAGNALTLSFSDGEHTVSISKESMRMVMGTDVLLSQNFSVYTSGKVYVNDGTLMESGLEDVYVLNGEGKKVKLGDTARTALTGNGQEVITCVTESGEIEWTFDGKGWGHSVGLSSWGAYGMAKAGYTFDKIIKHYYTGVSIAGFDK